MDPMVVTLILLVAIAVYLHTGNNPYPRRGARQWWTYWSLTTFVMLIPTVVLTREVSGAAAVMGLVTLPLMLLLYYRNKANRLHP